MAKLPTYLTRDENYKKFQKQEQRLADDLGGRKQKGSGSKRFNKGDVRMPELLTEAKRTDKRSISIKLEYVRKITEEAQAYGLIPAVAVEWGFTPDDAIEEKKFRSVERDWVLVPASFLKELLDVYRKRPGGS
jgi:hypothetical protein